MSDAPITVSTIPTACGRVFGRATLNMPAALNALSLAMIDLLTIQLREWVHDDRVIGIVLDSSNDKAFCAGGDVVALYHQIRQTEPGRVPRLAHEFFEREYRLDHRLHTCPKPILCWGHGIVLGGGVGLMVGASHRVATPKTRIAMPELGIGLYPDVGGSWFLARMPRQIGPFLALTGASLNAADARHAGLADVVLQHESHAQILCDITTTRWSAQRDADAKQLTKLLHKHELSPGESLLARYADEIDALIGDGALPGIASRFAAIDAKAHPWLAQGAASFARGSPTSAVLSLELQRRARSMKLADVFRLEYQASIGCCMHHDLPEGVRALLVDKDKSPRWQPASIAEVDDALIAAHLAPRFDGPHPLADL